MTQHELIFYENRSTPQIVPKGELAKPKAGYGKITLRRSASADEERFISTGKWLRVDEKGNTPNSPDYKKTQYRPQLVKQAATRIRNWVRTRLSDGEYRQLLGLNSRQKS